MSETIFDFTSRRRAALQAAREKHAEFEAEDELEGAIAAAHYQFEARRKFQREQWEKYRRAMAERRKENESR
jgi:hypothetical protein